MEFRGVVDIEASRAKVWEFLVDPTRVGHCGPGVESIEIVDSTRFKATAKVGIGFIRARFVVNMEMADLVTAEQASIRAHGQAPGSAVDAVATMTLTDTPTGGTRLDWRADVTIAGSLASVGARLIEGTANKMIADTFNCIRSNLAT